MDYDNPKGVARQRMMIGLCDEDFGPPFADILAACQEAKYGHGGAGRDFLSEASTPF
jgi:hypothetical protein